MRAGRRWVVFASDALALTCLAMVGRSVPSWKSRYRERSAARAVAGIIANTRRDAKAVLAIVPIKLLIVCLSLTSFRRSDETNLTPGNRRLPRLLGRPKGMRIRSPDLVQMIRGWAEALRH